MHKLQLGCFGVFFQVNGRSIFFHGLYYPISIRVQILSSLSKFIVDFHERISPFFFSLQMKHIIFVINVFHKKNWWKKGWKMPRSYSLVRLWFSLSKSTCIFCLLLWSITHEIYAVLKKHILYFLNRFNSFFTDEVSAMFEANVLVRDNCMATFAMSSHRKNGKEGSSISLPQAQYMHSFLKLVTEQSSFTYNGPSPCTHRI